MKTNTYNPFYTYSICTLFFFIAVSTLLASPLEQQVSEKRLTNGVTLLMSQRQTAPIASVQLWVRSGRVEDPPEQKGAGEIISRLLGGPVIRRRLSDTVPSLLTEGVQASSKCFDDSILIELKGPSSRTQEMVEALARMVAQPQFTSTEFAAVIKLLTDELMKKSNDENVQLEQHLLHLCYSIHPYRNHALDAMSNIQSISSNMILSEIKRRFVPENLIITTCGTNATDDILASALTSFGELNQGAVISRPAIIEPKAVTRRSFVSRGTFRENKVMMGYVTPPSQSSEIYPFMLLSELLDTRSTSELRREIMSQLPSDARLVVSFRPRRDPGLFTITISGADMDPAKVSGEVGKILWTAKDRSLRLSDLARAKDRLKAIMENQFSTPSKEATELGQWAVLEQKISFKSVTEGIDSVTVPHIKRIIEEYFQENSVAIAIQQRILLKPVISVPSSSKELLPEKISTASGINLQVTQMPDTSLTACNLILPVKAIAVDTKNVECLINFKTSLKEALLSQNDSKAIDHTITEFTSLNIFPRTISEPSDCMRVEFISASSKFIKIFNKVLEVFKKTFEPSFVNRSMREENILISIAGKTDPDICRKSVDDLFEKKQIAQTDTAANDTTFSAIKPENITEVAKNGELPGRIVITATAPRSGTSLEAATYCFIQVIKNRVIQKLKINNGLVDDILIYYHPAESDGKIIFVVHHTEKMKALVLTHLLNEFKLLAEHECFFNEIEQAIALFRMQRIEEDLNPSEISLKTGLNYLRTGHLYSQKSLLDDLRTVTPDKLKDTARLILSTAEPVYK